MKYGPVSSCTILVYEMQRELTASIVQQPKQNLDNRTPPIVKKTKPKHPKTFN